jgi:hypothetical protein
MQGMRFFKLTQQAPRLGKVLPFRVQLDDRFRLGGQGVVWPERRAPALASMLLDHGGIHTAPLLLKPWRRISEQLTS